MNSDKYMRNAAITAALMEAGIEIMRQNIRRRHGEASIAKVEELLGAWLRRGSDPLPWGHRWSSQD